MRNSAKRLEFLAIVFSCVFAAARSSELATQNLKSIQESLSKLGANVDPIPFISNITSDFPYKFMVQSPCANATICGSCTKLEIWLNLKNVNLNYELDFNCLKCSSGYPQFGSVSISGSPTSIPYSLDISNMCTWYSKAMVYTLWIFIFGCCGTCILCKCCSRKKSANAPDQYLAYKGPESVTTATVLTGGTASIGTLNPQFTQQSMGEQAPYYPPPQLGSNSNNIFANTMYPPGRYGAPLYPTPAQQTYEASLRPVS